ncbi:type VI secretion lipoprotein [compost metagenome]
MYQLRDRTRLEAASYEGLLNDGETVLGEDLLDARRVVVKPEAGVRLDVPMDEQAQFVAVVALFRVPDTRQNNWRLVLVRSELDPDRPRVIELGDNRVRLRELEEK